jgi:hypothetical protein
MTVASQSTSSYINIDCVEQYLSSRAAKRARDLTNGIVTPKKSKRVINSEGQANTCLVILFIE